MAASASSRPLTVDQARPNPGGLQELLHKRQASLALRSAASRPSREQPRLPGGPQVWGPRAASNAADLAERGRAGPPAALHGAAQAARPGAPIPEDRQAAGQAEAIPAAAAGDAQAAHLGSQGSSQAIKQQASMERQASAGRHSVEEAGGAPCSAAQRRRVVAALPTKAVKREQSYMLSKPASYLSYPVCTGERGGAPYRQNLAACPCYSHLLL